MLDHCGNADPKAFRPPGRAAEGWKRAIERLAKRPNLICKISGIVARVKKGEWGPEDLAPIVNHCLDAFGPDRVVFASDWPVCTRGASLKEWVTALRQIITSRPMADQRKLLHENAAAFYGV